MTPTQVRPVPMRAGPPASDAGREGRRRVDWRRWLLGLLVAAALTGAVLHFGEIENFGRLVMRARPAWLGLAFLLQLSTYASVAMGWEIVLGRAGTPRPLGPLIRIGVAKLFADQAMPSAGMGGNVLLVDRLTALGVPRGAAVAALLVSMLGYYTAYALLALVMLLLLWLHDKATPLMAGLVTTFLLVALAIPSLALWLRHRGSQPLPSRLEGIGVVRNLLEAAGEAPAGLIADRSLLLRVGACNGLVFLTDAATLLVCLLALGQPAGFGTAFIAFLMASIVVTLGPIPLGLGSFEATSTATLHLLGVPVEAAFAATMLFRMLTLWLPLLPGLFLMRASLWRPRHGRSPRSDNATSPTMDGTNT